MGDLSDFYNKIQKKQGKNMKKTNDQPINEVLNNMVKVLKLQPNLTKTKIESVWEETMGKTIAGYTRQIRLKNKVLFVKIESASLRSELHYGRDKILDRLNEILGERYLEEVVLE